MNRTRPYAVPGAPPSFWWLTRSGARLVEGTSPAPGKATPNPLFLRHTAAIAGLDVALLDVGTSIGMRCRSWLRDEGTDAGGLAYSTVVSSRRPPTGDLCPDTGRAQLGYDRARILFDRYTGWELHQLHHLAATHLGEQNVELQSIMAKTRHRNARSAMRYIRPAPKPSPRSPTSSTTAAGTADDAIGHHVKVRDVIRLV